MGCNMGFIGIAVCTLQMYNNLQIYMYKEIHGGWGPSLYSQNNIVIL